RACDAELRPVADLRLHTRLAVPGERLLRIALRLDEELDRPLALGAGALPRKVLTAQLEVARPGDADRKRRGALSLVQLGAAEREAVGRSRDVDLVCRRSREASAVGDVGRHLEGAG